MAVVKYEKTPDGGFLAIHDTGLIERFDAAGNSLGFEYGSAQQTPTGLPYGPAQTASLEEPAPPPDFRSIPKATTFDSAPQGQYGRSQAAQPQQTTPNPYTSSSEQTGGYGYAPPPQSGGAPIPKLAPVPQLNAPNAPAYANGQMHPAFGGQRMGPGGVWAQGSGGYDNRQQVRVPGGASAGPFEVSAAPMPEQRAQGGGTFFNDEGRSGGGGNTSPIYDKFRAKGNALASKLKGYGGGGSSYSGADTAAYRRQQREYRQQQRAYADGSYLYDQYKMRGFSKKMDPQQAEGFYYRPSMLIPKAVPGLSSDSPTYDWMKDLPAAQLSMLAYGKRGKARDGPSQFVNNLAKFYEAAAAGSTPSYEEMVKNLNTARNRSPLGAQFRNQPIGFAADTYESFVNAIMEGANLDPRVAAAKSEVASDLIDQYGSRFARRPVKRAPSIHKWVGQRMEW